MAHPARSLPPLSFDDPELDAPANDTVVPATAKTAEALPPLTFASVRAPANDAAQPEPVALAYPIPSVLPEPTPDPSFAAPPEPAAPSTPPEPVKLPALQAPPPSPSLEERVTDLVERAIERLPAWPEVLRFKLPVEAAYVVAVLALWLEFGMVIRAVRTVVTALAHLMS